MVLTYCRFHTSTTGNLYLLYPQRSLTSPYKRSNLLGTFPCHLNSEDLYDNGMRTVYISFLMFVGVNFRSCLNVKVFRGNFFFRSYSNQILVILIWSSVLASEYSTFWFLFVRHFGFGLLTLSRLYILIFYSKNPGTCFSLESNCVVCFFLNYYFFQVDFLWGGLSLGLVNLALYRVLEN